MNLNTTISFLCIGSSRQGQQQSYSVWQVLECNWAVTGIQWTVTGGYNTDSKVKRRFKKLNQKLKYSRTLKAQKLEGEGKKKKKKCKDICFKMYKDMYFFWHTLNNKIEKILEIA